MTAYNKSTNFAAKDSLPESDPAKIIKGSEFNTEFDNLVIAVNSKANTASPTFTGTPTAPTASVGTNTTQLATTAFVAAANTAILATNNTFTGTQTFRDNKFEVTDDVDTTKKLNLQLSGVTTATTRTLTVPDKNGTIATTDDLIQGTPLNAASNTVVSGSYAVTSSTTITITATNTFSVGQTVFITFTNTSGSALTAGDFTIVTASGSSFTITYGSSVTSAGTCVTSRYGIIALASSADVLAGTNTTRAVSSSTLKDSFSVNGLGAGQTWQNFTTSTRVMGTTYTNSTGKPILVVVGFGRSQSSDVTVGGVTIATLRHDTNNNNPGYFSFIVPNGATYANTGSYSGDSGAQYWSELR